MRCTGAALILAASAAFLAGCGYHVAGQAALLPADVHTIAVAPWVNGGIHYSLSNYLAGSVKREFIARTRYRIVSDPAKADVVLYGTVANMTAGGTLYDNATGQTTGGQIGVWIQFRLLDKQGKVLLNKPNLEFHQPYQIATNPSQYFDESEASMKRLSDDVAKTVVSAILEQF
jgi:outer membrane lipopolysaccharide assembly protein LptE/RlpB